MEKEEGRPSGLGTIKRLRPGYSSKVFEIPELIVSDSPRLILLQTPLADLISSQRPNKWTFQDDLTPDVRSDSKKLA